MWYYAQNGQTLGPVSFDKLKELASAGTLKPTDHILPVGSQEWRLAATQADLFARQVPPMNLPPKAAAGPPPLRAGGPPPLNEGPPSLPEQAITRGPMTWSIESHPALDDSPYYGRPDEPTFGRKVGRHFARLFTWNLQNVVVDEDEGKFLNSQGVADPTLQRYLCWRHSLLLILVFPIFLLAVLNTIDSLTDGLSDLNAFGKFILIPLILFPFALPFTALLALIVWYRPKLSWRLLLLGWVIGTAGPMLMHVVPYFSRLDIDTLVLAKLPPGVTEEQRRGVLGLVRVILSFGAFAILMIQQVIFGITAIQGTQRACFRLKTLLPQSSIPGLFLALTGPIYFFLVLPFFVMGSQLASNPLLIIGMLLLMSSPLIYTFNFKRMITPLTEPRDFTRIRLLQIIATVVFWAGFFLLLIYIFAVRVPFLNPETMQGAGGAAPADPNRPMVLEKTLIGFSSTYSWFRPWDWQLIRWVIVEVFGRSLFTMILVADLFMRVNSYIWLSSRKVIDSDSVKSYDELMERLQTSGRWDPESSQVEWGKK